MLKAPFDGVIGNKGVEVGDYVTAGKRLAALVPESGAYVDANFKETQLRTLRPGQSVDVVLDADPEHPITGTVESIAPAAGQVFSLLPPENATGNFTKIVQRVPVRVRVPPARWKAVGCGRASRRKSPLTPAQILRRTAPLRCADGCGKRGRRRRAGRAADHHPAPDRVPALIFGMFMAILDIQIVSSSLSEIQAGLSASSDEISWVQTAYLIAEVVMIPLSGFLARAMSTRYLFALSAAGFTAASLMCATATSINEMIFYPRRAGLHRRRHDSHRLRGAYTIFPSATCLP